MTANTYRAGPYVTTSAGRKTWSFGVYLVECYDRCGSVSTAVFDLATAEWNHGNKDVRAVVRQHNTKERHAELTCCA